MNYKWYAADFETAASKKNILDSETYVWGWGLSKIKENVTSSDVIYGYDIDDFIAYTLSNPGTYWFHNEKFDGSFIISFLLKNGFSYTESNSFDMGDFQYSVICNNMGQIYKITYKVNSSVVKIQNSLLKIPGTIKDMAKSLKLDVSKGEIDYNKHRDKDYKMTEEELDYLIRDVLILAKGMYELHMKNGNKAMTIGSDCMAKFKELQENFDELFPLIESQKVDRFIRNSYYGGYVYVKPSKQNKMITNGMTVDKNSMYPGVMHSSSGYLFPYGEPVYYKGNYKWDEEYPIYIQRLHIGYAKLKENRWPTINLGSSFSKSGHSEYATVLEDVELTLTYSDLNWLEKNYDIDDTNYYMIDGYKFKAKRGMFDKYIEFYMELKEKATLAKDPVERQLAKLMLNNLYGKFGTNPVRLSKVPIYNEETKRLQWLSKYDYWMLRSKKEGKVYLGKRFEFAPSGYIPVACFTTSYARNELWSAMDVLWDKFNYCDTDSLHLDHINKEELKKLIKIHKTKLGWWALESKWDKAIFLRAKTYAEHIVEKDEKKLDKPYWDIKACGMPENIKEVIKIEDFKIGSQWLSQEVIYNWLREGKFELALKKGYLFIKEAKLIPKQVDGGIILIERPFKITE